MFEELPEELLAWEETVVALDVVALDVVALDVVAVADTTVPSSSSSSEPASSSISTLIGEPTGTTLNAVAEGASSFKS